MPRPVKVEEGDYRLLEVSPEVLVGLLKEGRNLSFGARLKLENPVPRDCKIIGIVQGEHYYTLKLVSKEWKGVDTYIPVFREVGSGS